MSCTTNVTDIESVLARNNPVSIDTTDQDKRQKHISPNDERMKKFMEDLIRYQTTNGLSLCLGIMTMCL